MQSETWERRLTAILVADVSGYSRLMSDDETETHRHLRRQRQTIIDAEISAHRGRVTHAAGDGFLVEFPSIIGAVECAVCMQKKLAEYNLAIPENRRLCWRMGINFGDVIAEAGYIYGEDVNIAARLESLAEPGGICISERVYEGIRNKVDARFISLGQQWLKNIAEPIHVYRSESGAGVDSRPGSGRPEGEDVPHTILDRPSIAVLPFTNLMPGKDKQYLVDGVTEDLITNFSMSPEFFVIAHSSSFKFRDKDNEVDDIARKLGVRYVVTGSVQQDKERFRVTAQLIEAATGLHLWTGRFNRDNAELLATRDEITRSIAATLMATNGQIAKAELRRQDRKSPDSFTVYDHYLKGRYLLHRSILPPWEVGKEHSRRAKEEFSSAIAKADSSELPLAAGLAWQHAIDFEWGYESPEESLQLAFDNAVVAVKQGPENHLAHWAMGWAYLFAKRDYERCMHHYNRARELNVGDSRLLAEMAQPLIYTGQYDRAVVQLKQAIRLNPYHEQWYDEFLAWAYEEIGKPEKTIKILNKFSELESISGYGVLACACAQTGREAQFRETVETMDTLCLAQLEQPFTAALWRSWVSQKQPYRNPDRAERVIAIMEKGLKSLL
jgi:TolB-like protein/class 3 adenylate cyclase